MRLKFTSRSFNDWLDVQRNLAIALLVSQWGCTQAQTQVQAQTAPPSMTQEQVPRKMPGYYEKQGYPKEQAAAKLDPEVRALLDAALRIYREPGLFTDRKRALEALGVHNTTRRYLQDKPERSRYRAYIDTFAKEGLFARPAWTGLYSYQSTLTEWVDTWGGGFRINVDAKLECQDSRAVEGYLDLVLEPGLRGYSHPPPDMIWRHEAGWARPSAKPLSNPTPGLSMTFSKGCFSELSLGQIFETKEINDDHAHD